MSIADRYKPRAYVFTEEKMDAVWKIAGERRLFDGEILDILYGKNSRDRPDNAYEAIRRMDKYFLRKYGHELISTTAHRQEKYEGEKKKRRG